MQTARPFSNFEAWIFSSWKNILFYCGLGFCLIVTTYLWLAPKDQVTQGQKAIRELFYQIDHGQASAQEALQTFQAYAQLAPIHQGKAAQNALLQGENALAQQLLIPLNQRVHLDTFPSFATFQQVVLLAQEGKRLEALSLALALQTTLETEQNHLLGAYNLLYIGLLEGDEGTAKTNFLSLLEKSSDAPSFPNQEAIFAVNKVFLDKNLSLENFLK